jgi:hypothetical protein
VSTFVPKGQFLARKKSQLSLIGNAFLNAFQAYDEGLIPERSCVPIESALAPVGFVFGKRRDNFVKRPTAKATTSTHRLVETTKQ